MNKSFTLCLPIRAGILLLSTLFLMACGTAAHSYSYRMSLTPEGFSGNQYMRTKLLGSIALSSAKTNGIPMVELSDIAWDGKTQTLYGLSDNAYLYTMKLKFSNNQLLSASIIKAVKLKGANKKVLSGANKDSEGLDLIRNNNRIELIISFEGNSRVDRYNTNGDYLGKITLPKKIANKRSYRHGNKALESVVVHPKFGVITAGELPLKANFINTQTIYSQHGKEWNFPRYKAAESSITALEVLPNGDILVLERAFSGIFQPLVISLRQLQVKQCDSKNNCPIKDIAVFSSANGWNMDNFEGLTHLSGNRYLMVSDDNKSPIQQTLMVMFEILP